MLADAAEGGEWSPDGKQLLYSSVKNGTLENEYRLLDLETGAVSAWTGGQQTWVFGWSDEGIRFGVDASLNLVKFDPNTGKWVQLLKSTCASVEASSNRQDAYCGTSDVPNHKTVRVRVSDGHVEPLMEIKGLRRVVDDFVGTTLGVLPDGSVLLTRDVGLEEIYALSVKWP